MGVPDQGMPDQGVPDQGVPNQGVFHLENWVALSCGMV